MRLLPRALILVLSLTLLAAQGPSPAESQAPDPLEVIGRVGETEITRAEHSSEVNRLIPLNYFHATVPQGRRDQFQQQALDSLIERTLIWLDARRRSLTVSDEEIHTKFKETLKQVGPQYDKISPAEFEGLLKPFRARVVRRLLIDKNELRFETQLPAISEQAMRTRFKEFEGQLLSTEKSRFRHILLKLEPSASSVEAKATFHTMEEIKERVDKGGSFEELAKKHSEDIFAGVGGDIGFVTQAEFAVPGLAQQAFDLKDGQVSEVMNSIYGVHLFLRVETQERLPLTFEQAAPQLRGALELEQRDGLREAWLAELHQAYPVEILVDFEPAGADSSKDPGLPPKH